mmetsp:Transcript_26864/g.61824  ORF Transcript_26864/g.61824 Transcript_26864/m.61824 type:complete len:271 (+) Transcript_26864:635-1447(+)
MVSKCYSHPDTGRIHPDDSRHACFSLTGFVGIVSFGTETTRLLVKLECIVHETTVTTQIFMVAIQQVLFTEGNQFPRFDVLGTFQRARGRECPTRTARSLILHRRNATHLDPIHIIRKGQGGHGLKLARVHSLHAAATVNLAAVAVGTKLEVALELILGHVRIFIVSKDSGVVFLGIVLFNLGIIVQPSTHGLLEGGVRDIDFGVFLHPTLEFGHEFQTVQAFFERRHLSVGVFRTSRSKAEQNERNRGANRHGQCYLENVCWRYERIWI